MCSFYDTSLTTPTLTLNSTLQDIPVFSLTAQQRPYASASCLRREEIKMAGARVRTRNNLDGESTPVGIVANIVLAVCRVDAALDPSPPPTRERLTVDEDARRPPQRLAIVERVHLEAQLAASTVTRRRREQRHERSVRLPARPCLFSDMLNSLAAMRMRALLSCLSSPSSGQSSHTSYPQRAP